MKEAGKLATLTTRLPMDWNPFRGYRLHAK